ncbi:MAG: hypothetical protein RL266_1340 [Bacteroidota bacterium]
MALRSSKRGRLTVLSLHRISDERNPFWNPIKPLTFDALLSYCKKNYQVIAFSQLACHDYSPKGKPILILSFDDGYYDFYEYALPLLVKHGLPANHNIVNECATNGMTIWTERLNLLFEEAMSQSLQLSIELPDKQIQLHDFSGSWTPFYLETFKCLLQTPNNERNKILKRLEETLGTKAFPRMMNWDEIRECQKNNVEIGSHTFSHDSLGTISDLLALHHEIVGSKKDIEKHLGNSVAVLALPNGQTGAAADEVIAGSDYDFVLYANEGLNQLRPSPEAPSKIARINLVDEPFPQMALRMEQFHNIVRRYV